MGPAHQGGRHFCGLMAKGPNRPGFLVTTLVTIGRLPVSRDAMQRGNRGIFRDRQPLCDFFGEIAALRRARRSATITAVTRTSLLVLDAHDLHALMDREQRIADQIREVARGRIGHEVLTSKGDLIAEEIEEETASSAEVRENG